MGKLEKIYLSSPPLLQTLAVNAYSVRNSLIRYGAANRKYLGQIESINRDIEKIYAYQLNRIKQMLEIAYGSTEYYHSILDPVVWRGSDTSLQEIMDKLPILSKESVKERNNELFSGITKNALFLNTSGTSGSPITVKTDMESRARNYAFYREMLRRHRVDVFERSVTFAGRTIVNNNRVGPPFWKMDYVTRTLFCSSYHLSSETVGWYVRRIESYSPKYIDTYPSAIYALAILIQEANVHHRIHPRVIFTSSETMTSYQKEVIESVFRCTVIDHYGCTEMVAFADQDNADKGFYCPNNLYGITEVYNDDGLPAEEGEEAELVCTGLVNSAMPLIRYRVGDRVQVGEVQRYCGFRYYQFSEILGRNDDVIVTPEGRRIGRLDPVFKGVHGVKRAQIIQEDAKNIRVLVVPESGRQVEDSDQLVENLLERTSRSMSVRVQTVGRIPSEVNGKFKAVVNRMAANNDQ